jgi:hypothetical protein
MARLSDIALARVIHLDRQRRLLARGDRPDRQPRSALDCDMKEMRYHLAAWQNHSRSWRHSISPDTGSPSRDALSRT